LLLKIIIHPIHPIHPKSAHIFLLCLLYYIHSINVNVVRIWAGCMRE
jgi:hypothetical protein